ncbi:TRAP transporter substrate-binding protein [Natronincola ferrireducens]|uniref:Tripartite ATP-independent transporter solute receptor, DctP family n=1 Tax=Natronincola ferrireducens TaxID=393762 RepID=A0A1G8YS11_9FIRM|nr:TRAP transporter substrate-binding protein [Natronincola ferrireducens]SDK05214.1 tripartite ATP-independent transporter solute receptor, DctP family [Natronincola ferrireducens]
MKNRWKKLSSILISLVLIVSLTACGQNTSTDSSADSSSEGEGKDKQPIIMRLAENQPDNNPVSIAMYKFAELLDEKTNGEIKVEVYTGAQLGQEPETIEQAQVGIVEFTRVNSVVLAEVASEMGVFTLPYIFADNDHKYRVLDGEIGQEALDALEQYNLVGFGYMEAGTRHFYTTKPVRSLEDLKGMKIRVQPAQISIKMTELLGATPTPMNYGEVYSGLQTGVIDGAENDYVSYYTSSHYEVAKYYILDGHLSPPALLVMNKQAFDNLSKEHQEAVQEAAWEAALYERELMFAFQEESRDNVVQAGTEIIEVDVSEFQSAVQPIYEEFPQYKDIIERIRALQ